MIFASKNLQIFVQLGQFSEQSFMMLDLHLIKIILKGQFFYVVQLILSQGQKYLEAVHLPKIPDACSLSILLLSCMLHDMRLLYF